MSSFKQQPGGKLALPVCSRFEPKLLQVVDAYVAYIVFLTSMRNIM
jgi:hypothetical protein